MIARKLPVEVEVIQFNGFNEGFKPYLPKEILEFFGEKVTDLIIDVEERMLGIKTLEGIMNVSEEDWIIKGVNGEFYPCKPDIFAKTYEIIG